MSKIKKFTKGETAVYSDRRLIKVESSETDSGNVRISYYDAESGENIRMWVDARALLRVT